jgi:hypothetical protein
MTADPDNVRDLYQKDARGLTDDEIRRIKAASDDELMRFSGTAHLVPIVESTRRLRETIAAEERAIKRLTIVLVVMTVVLVGFGVIDLVRH